MNLQRRQLLFLAASVAFPAIPDIARGQTYPAHPVRVIVPFAPGGPSDVFGRLIALKLSRNLDQQFYVENQPGAGGNLGMGAGARAAPDGYTITVVGTSYVVNPSLYAKFRTIHSGTSRRSHWRRSLPIYWLFIRRSPQTTSRN
jgi:tripartite-type tricarboxylate transporter receptor subunit TctC